MRITSKYVLREHLGPLTFALGALTSLLLLNYIARKFGDLVGKGLPPRAIAEFFVLSVPFTIAMTLPMAVLVATLYAFSRLGSENEITAFKASGVGMGRLLGPVLIAATVLAGVMVFFNDQVLPASNHRLSQLTQSIARTSPTFALRERVVNEVPDGSGFFLKASTIDRAKNSMQDVTIYDMTGVTPRTIHADSGAFVFLPNKKDLQLSLYDGEILEVGDQKPDQLQRMQFVTQLVRVRDVLKSFEAGDANGGFKSDREMTICELQDAYLKSRRDWLLAKHELAVAIADSLKRPKPAQPKPGRVFLGVGNLYCQGVKQVNALFTKPAAKGPKPQVPLSIVFALPQQDTVKKPAVDTAKKPAVDTARPVPTPPVVTPPASDVPAQFQKGYSTTHVPTPTIPQPGTNVVPGAPAPMAGSQAATDTARPAVQPNMPPSAGVAATDPYAFGASVMTLARSRERDALSTMNNFDVEIHKKFALAVACIVFVLLGAPIALRFPSGGVGLVIGASLLVFATYYSFLIAGENLAGRGMLPPWVAMWGANVLFTIVGLPLALRMGRYGGSNRAGGFGEMIDNLRYRWRSRSARRAPAQAPAGD